LNSIIDGLGTLAIQTKSEAITQTELGFNPLLEYKNMPENKAITPYFNNVPWKMQKTTDGKIHLH